MKKLQKILIMTVLVAMMVGLGAIVSSAAVTMEPAKVLASFDGSQSASIDTRGAMSVATKGTNKYYDIDFTTSGANANFSSVSGNYAFLGKGDYIVMEFDFMAEDWSKVKSILVGWNSRNSSGGALNDMHFSFGNDNGKPKITGNPLSGSIVLSESAPGTWHHFSMIVQIGGEHTVKNGKDLTAVKGQDAVEAYAYIDGQMFAKNLIGDGKEFWSTDTTFWQTMRLTSSGDGQRMCIDNIYVAQYQNSRDLREFFKYREKNGGAFPDINAVSYPFLAYDAEYDYPLGTPNCKVVELNGTETLFDRFDKAAKRAASSSGAKLVLLSDIKGATVKYPVKIDRAGYNLDYTVAPNLRAEESTVLNPITGQLSTELSFVKKTKYAYFRWAIDHTGEAFDSRGYTPLTIGEAIAYNGNEFEKSYYRDGVLYTFGGQWLLNGKEISSVPVFATNSYYTLTPAITAAEVYAIVEAMDGTVVYACSADEFVSAVAAAAKDSVVTLVKDVELAAPLAINTRITLDLAGKALTSTADGAAIQLADVAADTVITSSAAGASITANGPAFETACAFTFKGENILTTATNLLRVSDSVIVEGLVIDGGVFLISGSGVLLNGDVSFLEADIDATIVADTYLVASWTDCALTLNGVLSGVRFQGSGYANIVLSEGLLLSGVSSFAGDALPNGVSLADDALVIAAKNVVGENGVATDYVVMKAEEAVLLVWEDGVMEYVAPGEEVGYGYADYYDAKKFYTPNGLYEFTLDAVTTEGNVADAAWVGKTVTVAPLYDSTAFYVVVANPDGTFEAYTEAVNLAELLSSGKYAEGTTFALGRKNMILENALISVSYSLDLNGYGLLITGENKIVGAELTFKSTIAGASLYADAEPAFVLEAEAAFIIEDENIASIGGSLESE
jgi:hypothetical protein